jgi:IS5 family transposase
MAIRFTHAKRRTRMRRKKETVLCFESNDEGLPKVLRDYPDRYRAIGQVLDRNPEILDAVHLDLRKLSQGGGKGREGDFTSENLLRALGVEQAEGLPFREAVIRMGGDGFLQAFLRTRKKAVMDFTFLDKCLLPIRPETWKRVNELLGRYGVAQRAFNPKVIRTEDTTVVESNIHWPTDSSRLWDTWRVASRLLGRAREILPESVPHRFHTRKIKKLSRDITRTRASARRRASSRSWRSSF